MPIPCRSGATASGPSKSAGTPAVADPHPPKAVGADQAAGRKAGNQGKSGNRALAFAQTICRLGAPRQAEALVEQRGDALGIAGGFRHDGEWDGVHWSGTGKRLDGPSPPHIPTLVLCGCGTAKATQTRGVAAPDRPRRCLRGLAVPIKGPPSWRGCYHTLATVSSRPAGPTTLKRVLGRTFVWMRPKITFRSKRPTRAYRSGRYPAEQAAGSADPWSADP
jgi:hypothetical protein